MRNTFIHLRANGLPDMLPAQMAILLPGWIKPKKNLALIFKPFNHETSKALCHSRVPFFIVEKSVVMVYNKLFYFCIFDTDIV